MLSGHREFNSKFPFLNSLMSHRVCQFSGCRSGFANGLGVSEWFIGVPTVGHIRCGTAAPRHWLSEIALCPSRSAVEWLKALCQCTSIHCLPGIEGCLANYNFIQGGQLCPVHQIFCTKVVCSSDAQECPRQIVQKYLCLVPA